jgi:hypothetical protein
MVDPFKVYHYAAACSYIPYVAAAYESTRPGPGSRTCQARGYVRTALLPSPSLPDRTKSPSIARLHVQPTMPFWLEERT